MKFDPPPWILGSLLLLLMPSLAQAERTWEFTILDDGRPCFRGLLSAPDDIPPVVVASDGLCTERIQLGSNSVLDRNLSGHVTLEGNVEFHFEDLPPVHLERLRLIYDPDPEENGDGSWVGGNKDWLLHPQDTSTILSELYKHENIRRLKERGRTLSPTSQNRITIGLLGLGVGFALGILCSVVWSGTQQSRRL